MHKTIYIEIDEEIIEIISKIRKTSSEDIFLVIPKNSLLTQGMVNLKLLKKEVLKIGKKITLITSDQHSREIIKRVGLKSRNKSVEDFVPKTEFQKESPVKTSEKVVPTIKDKPIKRNIGSTNFYNDEKDQPNIEKKENVKFKSESFQKKVLIKNPNSFGNEHIQNYENKKKFQAEEIINPPKSIFKIKSFKNEDSSIKQDSLSDFYNPKEENFKKNNSNYKSNTKKNRFYLKNKMFYGFASILLICLGFGAFWVSLNWPKMRVDLVLKKQSKEISMDLTVCEKEQKDCLPGNYKELIISHTEQFGASGEKFSDDTGMARGIVKIYNHYSTKPQPLIKTTRLLSKEGKLFRLIETVTIPGMEDDKPTSIEVKVIADEVGRDYNLSSTEFKIEGFKGNEKYNKFKVFSENSMLGGANDTENKKVKVVTDQDIASAREKTIELFNTNLKKNIQEQLNEDEIFTLESIEKEILNSDSSYATGDIINKFSYTVKEKIKLIAFKKDAFENEILNSINKKEIADLEFEKIAKTNFEKDIANYEEKKLDLSIKSIVNYWPIVEPEIIEGALSEKNNSEIKDYLTSLNNIEKAVILYTPSWLSTFPIKNKNITIRVVK